MFDISGKDQGHPRPHTSSSHVQAIARRGGSPESVERPDSEHWRFFLGTLAGISSDLHLDEKLAHVLQAAVELTGASGGTVEQLDRDGHPDLRQPSLRRFTRQGLDTVIAVGGQVVGHLRLSQKKSGAEFMALDTEVASALAGVAGMVIESAQLREQAVRRNLWLSPTPDLARDAPDDAAFQRVADWARDVAEADVAWVVAGPDPTAPQLRAVSGFPASAEAMSALQFDTSLEQRAAFTGHSMTARHIAAHPRAVDVPASLGFGPTDRGLVVPLKGSTGLAIVITVAWNGTDDDVRGPSNVTLAKILADQGPLVLLEAHASRTDEGRAVLQDRDRIAQDLHDLVIQRLFAVGLDMEDCSLLGDSEEIARRLSRNSQEIDTTIRDIRRIIFRLGSMEEDDDPRTAIEALVERATRTMKIRPSLTLRGPIRTIIGSELLADVLAVLSEALSNAVRHAQATTCAVEVSVGEGVVVRVTDDGTGISESAEESGLANIRERAQRRGGRLTLTSSPGLGTSVEWKVSLS